MTDPAASRALLSASPRLFRNPILDKLSRVHHFAPLAIYLPIAGVLLWLGVARLGAATTVMAVIGGYVAWTLVEYFGHRYFFHLVLPGRWGARAHFLIHGVHHVHPSDPLRLVMPPLMSAPIVIGAFLLLRAACGPTLVLPALAGFLLGYVAYDMLHFHVHHGRSRTRWGAALRRRHMHHHFQDDSVGFGISCPWWDEVFRTGPVSKTPA